MQDSGGTAGVESWQSVGVRAVLLGLARLVFAREMFPAADENGGLLPSRDHPAKTTWIYASLFANCDGYFVYRGECIVMSPPHTINP
jgi:hypothetical protein